MQKYLIGAIALIMLFACASALGANDITWNGTVTINLSKTSFTEAEPITGTILVYNLESYPLLGGKFVMHLAQGAYAYPSQESSSDNISYEKIIDLNWLLPNSKKEVPFSIDPQKEGAYRLDLYAWVVKSKMVGASNILYNPISTNLTVTGKPQVVRATINRTITSFNGFSGPVGFPIKENSSFSGEVLIVNNSAVEKKGLELGVTICEWSSATCEGNEIRIKVPTLLPEDNKIVKVALIAPLIPSAYEINMKLYNGTEIESIYKSRVIVSGGTAKIRKIAISGLDTKNYSINAMIAGSPDHFNYPDFENFTFGVEVYKDGAIIEEKSVNVALIKTEEVIGQTFDLSSKSFSKICGKITKDGLTYDRQCFDVPLEELQNAYDNEHPKVVDVKYTYDESTSALTITLEKEIINVRARLFSTEETLFVEEIKTNNSFTKTVNVPKENLMLAVDDFDAKQQVLIALNFALPIEKRNDPILGETLSPLPSSALPECNANVCASGTICPIQAFESKQGPCCNTPCIQQIVSLPRESILSIPLITWIAVLLLLIALLAGINAYKVAKK